MRLRFRPQPGRGCSVSRRCLTVCLPNALHHFFHSQKVQHAGMLVGWVRARLFNIAHNCSRHEEAGKRNAVTAKRNQGNSHWKLTRLLRVALLSRFSRMGQLHPAEVNFERQPGQIHAICDSEQDFRHAGGCILQ
jgi:hypothetical protein